MSPPKRRRSGVVNAFLADAAPVEGQTTYGDTGQRYEAAAALRPDSEYAQARYLLDSATGEYVVQVGDLLGSARRTLGTSLARGWLDARMHGIGWSRGELRGFGLPGRAGRRQGPHARVSVYRGHLPDEAETPDCDESVNT